MVMLLPPQDPLSKHITYLIYLSNILVRIQHINFALLGPEHLKHFASTIYHLLTQDQEVYKLTSSIDFPFAHCGRCFSILYNPFLFTFSRLPSISNNLQPLLSITIDPLFLYNSEPVALSPVLVLFTTNVVTHKCGS
jgi:hypothetical protein